MEARVDSAGTPSSPSTSSSRLLRAIFPYLLLLGLTLIFFAPLVLHPGKILYSDYSDILAEHLPAKEFLVRSWQETGEIPLWCPYQFGGMPFVHDIQVGVLYPLHLPLYLLPVELVGAGLSWLVVLHIYLAGCTMYFYAAHRGLTTSGALIAAIGYMFAGKWMLHMLLGGHYITLGMVWLPLVLYWLEEAIRRHGLGQATLAGVAFGLVVLGTHPQWIFYSGLFVALWTLTPALEEAGYLSGSDVRSNGRTSRALLWWAGLGLWTATIAAGLGAVHLLPTLEATPYSTRSLGVVPTGQVGGALYATCWLVGPALSTAPANFMWDERGGFGLLWLFCGLVAYLLGRPRERFQVGIVLLLLAFALGGGVLLQHLPVFKLFRQPTRMHLITTFPLAFLAGQSVDVLARGGLKPRRPRLLLASLVGVTLLLVALDVAVIRQTERPLRIEPYWYVLPGTLLVGCWLIGRRPAPGPMPWAALLLIDVWSLAWPLVAVRTHDEIFPETASLRFLREHRVEHYRVLDRETSATRNASPFGSGSPVAIMNGIPSLRGYNPFDVLRYKEYLQFMADSADPLRPFYSHLTFPIINDCLIANRSLCDLLGVRYVLQPAAPKFALKGEPPLTPENGWTRVAVDDKPVVFDFLDGGMCQMPPFAILENQTVLPRAFVVGKAEPLPVGPEKILKALKTTPFQKVVLLEGELPQTPGSEMFLPPMITEYLPNRVTINGHSEQPGWLVLSDVWYPGWKCWIDGQECGIRRANYLFRAVPLPPGDHQVVFRFEPASWTWGLRISAGTILCVLLVLAISLGRVVTRRG